MPQQDKWRNCIKCQVMFFDGHVPANKGRCPVGGGHEAAGFNFVLPHDVPENYRTQSRWRNCWKCQVMFFDGHVPANKGRCPSGGGHEAAGYNFVLPHTEPPRHDRQTWWRNCAKCQALFFQGHPHTQGVCPAGGGHAAAGPNFTLPHVPGPVPSRPPDPPPPRRPVISVSVSSSETYRVTGSGFRGNVPVSVRMSDGFGNPDHYFHTRSSASGGIDVTFTVSCNSGWTLYFSASDGTVVPKNVDSTGQLWSNVVQEACR